MGEINERIMLGINNPTNPHQKNPHITIHEVTIAAELLEKIPSLDKFIELLQIETAALFDIFFVRKKILFNFEKYEIIGTKKVKWLAAIYNLSNDSIITSFRIAFYDKFLELVKETAIAQTQLTRFFIDNPIAGHI